MSTQNTTLPPLPEWSLRDDLGGLVPSDIRSELKAYARAAIAAQAQQPLESIEQYRLQMAGISTAAIGYWKIGDGIRPAYDTLALRDVAKLYAKYDALYKAQQAQGVPADQLPTKEHIRELAQEAADQVMEQAQVFASAWSLVGGRFDSGNALEDAEEAKSELRTLVRSLADLAAETVRPAAAPQQQALELVDAERWRETLMRVGATRNEWVGGGHMFMVNLQAPPNVMQGSVAQHFTAAIDAARGAA